MVQEMDYPPPRPHHLDQGYLEERFKLIEARIDALENGSVKWEYPSETQYREKLAIAVKVPAGDGVSSVLGPLEDVKTSDELRQEIDDDIAALGMRLTEGNKPGTL